MPVRPIALWASVVPGHLIDHARLLARTAPFPRTNRSDGLFARLRALHAVPSGLFGPQTPWPLLRETYEVDRNRSTRGREAYYAVRARTRPTPTTDEAVWNDPPRTPAAYLADRRPRHGLDRPNRSFGGQRPPARRPNRPLRRGRARNSSLRRLPSGCDCDSSGVAGHRACARTDSVALAILPPTNRHLPRGGFMRLLVFRWTREALYRVTVAREPSASNGSQRTGQPN